MESPVVIWEGSPTWRSRFGFTVVAVLLSPLLVGLVMLGWQWATLASIRYRLTNKRVEWETGLVSRKIDGIDVWRIRHVEYFQTLGDRLGGVSRLHLFVQDSTEPEVVILGLPAGREIYDAVAAAAQVARQGTIGLVQ